MWQQEDFLYIYLLIEKLTDWWLSDVQKLRFFILGTKQANKHIRQTVDKPFYILFIYLTAFSYNSGKIMRDNLITNRLPQFCK